MATIYEKLYLSEDLTKINFKNYIQSLVQGLFYSHTTKKGQINPKIEIEDIMLNIETAVPCGLIISELVSNSLKHAFPDDEEGEIQVSLQRCDGKYELLISDNGIGFPEDINFKNTNTLGLQLVNNLIDQIDGEITLNRSHGTEFKITFKELKYVKRI
jgi:two-component sensor histidine kinase